MSYAGGCVCRGIPEDPEILRMLEAHHLRCDGKHVSGCGSVCGNLELDSNLQGKPAVHSLSAASLAITEHDEQRKIRLSLVSVLSDFHCGQQLIHSHAIRF